MNGGDGDSKVPEAPLNPEAPPNLEEAAGNEVWMVDADGGGVGGGGDVGVDETLQVTELQQQGPNQLALFFQGETYIFDSVPPEREKMMVQAVLLLLRGNVAPPPPPATVMGTALNQNSGAAEYGSPSLARLRRQEALIRFREKKKKFCFAKRVKYAVRKEVASRMKRHKGQFVSSKGDTNAPTADTNAVENPPAEKGGKEEIHQTACKNCGLGKDETPMMRRGPCGTKSFCNACGLMWATKGKLRKLSQASSSVKQEASANQNEQSVDNDSGGLSFEWGDVSIAPAETGPSCDEQ